MGKVNTTYGSVYALGSDHKYVIKKMENVNDDDALKVFLNEVRVGMTPGIQRVGPRIYGYKVRPTGDSFTCEYIMDDFTRGDPTLRSMLLREYIDTYKPGPDHLVFKKLKTTLRNFWLISKGYHGDLHTNNIAVVFKPGGHPVRVMIFDYGSHKRTKVKFTRNMSLNNMTRVINANFARSTNKPGRNSYMYPESKFIVKSKVYNPVLGQPRRSNSNMLRTHSSIAGVIMRTNRPNNKSLMNVISLR